MRHIVGLIVLAAAVFIGAFVAPKVPLILSMVNGFTAKTICSHVFVSGREPQEVVTQEIFHSVPWPLTKLLDVAYYPVTATATSSLAGHFARHAQFHPDAGCTLLPPGTPQPKAPHPKRDRTRRTGNWPLGDDKIDLEYNAKDLGLDFKALMNVIKEQFEEPKDVPFGERINTRAVVVLYKGQIVGEKYASGFSPEMALPSWSMAKSVLSAMCGVLERQGKLTIDTPVQCEEWQLADGTYDERGRITINDLLHMSSGLDWTEEYVSLTADPTVMLFGVEDAGNFAAQSTTRDPPGEKFYYSSGDTNILSRHLRTYFDHRVDYWAFPREELFEPIGMTSAIMDTDHSGTFIASSFMSATPRDYARFGQLYLQEGEWQGKQILNREWVKYTITPAKGAKQGEYGAHWWLNAGAANNKTDRPFPRVPETAFYASGFDDQVIMVIPSHDLVIVRLGMNRVPDRWDRESFYVKLMGVVDKARRKKERASAKVPSSKQNAAA